MTELGDMMRWAYGQWEKVWVPDDEWENLTHADRYPYEKKMFMEFHRTLWAGYRELKERTLLLLETFGGAVDDSCYRKTVDFLSGRKSPSQTKGRGLTKDSEGFTWRDVAIDGISDVVDKLAHAGQMLWFVGTPDHNQYSHPRNQTPRRLVNAARAVWEAHRALEKVELVEPAAKEQAERYNWWQEQGDDPLSCEPVNPRQTYHSLTKGGEL